MNRFGPDLVVWGCEPCAEDGWSQIRSGRFHSTSRSLVRGARSPWLTRSPAPAAKNRCAPWPPTEGSARASCSAAT